MSELPQGDLRLLGHPVARGLLVSSELARVAYVARDGTPRVLPMLFHWNGEEIVLPTFSGSAKLGALRERPDLAITIDVPGPPPEVLLIRGRAEITEVDGILPEYAAAHRRYYGEEQGTKNVEAADRPGVRMGRIAVRPTWAGVLDFQTRLPGALTRG
ncbi:pyridoxamine 5'-phosphate oxidase family protein [Nonomuraea spiralis]|uniref:Pyridoxamine 5'-phosphate oxidase family protein n=1 Tax=Nonomuraea spiralis TaxID=46182 RepID=A0ABV5IAM5_9ACTN|nr:pyridoxamine 5'-phosphate oxidase family protein [Nonomuraea spiralis]GGT03823.1 pyridoxamine 5'-phosphate oxidase [Nonomuraea spiralis]